MTHDNYAPRPAEMTCPELEQRRAARRESYNRLKAMRRCTSCTARLASADLTLCITCRESRAAALVVKRGNPRDVDRSPRPRVLRIMRYLDWTPMREVAVLLESDMDCMSAEYNGIGQALIRLARAGLLESRKLPRFATDYRITAAGKAALRAA